MVEPEQGHVYHGNYSWQVILYLEGDDGSSCMCRRQSVALLHCVLDVRDTPEKYELNPSVPMVSGRAPARPSFVSR